VAVVGNKTSNWGVILKIIVTNVSFPAINFGGRVLHAAWLFLLGLSAYLDLSDEDLFLKANAASNAKLSTSYSSAYKKHKLVRNLLSFYNTAKVSIRTQRR
jgi:hypothetical protein